MISDDRIKALAEEVVDAFGVCAVVRDVKRHVIAEAIERYIRADLSVTISPIIRRACEEAVAADRAREERKTRIWVGSPGQGVINQAVAAEREAIEHLVCDLMGGTADDSGPFILEAIRARGAK